MTRLLMSFIVLTLSAALGAHAQPPGRRTGRPGGRTRQRWRGPGPAPSHANLDYAPADPPTSNGHKLDLYVPSGGGPIRS